jgi:hypothetical protein
MASTTKVPSVVYAVSSDRISDVPITPGQTLYVYDKGRIALDITVGGETKRTWYNQIIILDSEDERQITAPAVDKFYFVRSTAVLWTYTSGGWKKITREPDDFLFIGDELPSDGTEGKLYVDKVNKQISVWTSNGFLTVADKLELELDECTDEDIDAMFE